jgi:glycosyltransferase 2 family protein
VSNRWRTLTIYAGVALGLGLLLAFLWRLDLDAVLEVMADADLGWLGLACVAVLAHYALQGLRWQILLHHIAPGLKLRTVWRATTVLWAFNTILGLRAGTLLRPAVVTMDRDVPYTAVLFTVVAETVCEAFGLVAFVLISLQMLPPDAAQSGSLAQARTVGTWAAVVALALLVVVILLSSNGARNVVDAWCELIPSERVRQGVLSTFDQLVEGMAAVGDPLRLLIALVATAAVWGAWTLSISCTLWAFGLDLPIAAAMFIQAGLAVTMVVPQGPGFLGTFQAVTMQGLELFSAPEAESQAIALALWAVCFVPISVLGVYDGWRLGIGFGRDARERTFQQLADAADERTGAAIDPLHPDATDE